MLKVPLDLRSRESAVGYVSLHWIKKTAAISGAFGLGAACASKFWLWHFEGTIVDSARTGVYIKAAQEVRPEDELDKIRNEVAQNRANNTDWSHGPRVITARGEAELDGLLFGPTKGSLTVISISFDPEGVALATQIEGIFKRSGWEVEDRQITPRVIFRGFSASVPPDRADAHVFEVLWTIFDDLQLEREACVEPGRTNLTITIGVNDGRGRLTRSHNNP